MVVRVEPADQVDRVLAKPIPPNRRSHIGAVVERRRIHVSGAVEEQRICIGPARQVVAVPPVDDRRPPDHVSEHDAGRRRQDAVAEAAFGLDDEETRPGCSAHPRFASAGWLSNATSASTISRARSGVRTVGLHPSRDAALEASPIRASTSVGRR